MRERLQEVTFLQLVQVPAMSYTFQYLFNIQLLQVATEPVSIAYRRWQDHGIIGSTKLRNIETIFGAPFWQIHRADLLDALSRVAFQENGIGHVPQLHLAAKAVALARTRDGRPLVTAIGYSGGRPHF